MSGGVRGAAGPVICGNGSTRSSARRTVRGGASSFSRCRIDGALYLPAQTRLAGQLQQHRADHPDDREAVGRAREQAAEGVEHPKRRDHREAAARERSEHPRDDAEDTRADQRADETRDRRIGRPGAAVEDVRRRARAENRTGREAAERERRCDQAAAQPVQGGERSDRERDPIDARHREPFGGPETDPCSVPPSRYTAARSGA